MTFVITDRCLDCKYTYCAAVCPVDAFHEAPDRLFINPESCIDCNACKSECPVDAIYHEDDVPMEDRQAIAENAAQAPSLPILRGTLVPLKGPRCVDPNAD